MDQDGNESVAASSLPQGAAAKVRKRNPSRGGNVLPILSVALLILAAGAFLYLTPSITAVAIAERIATPGFVLFYSAILLTLTFGAIVRCERQLSRETAIADQLINAIGEESDPKLCLRLLNRLTDARITTNPDCRDELLTSDERATISKSGVLRSVAVFLGLVTSVPSSRHSLEGLRPAAIVLHAELRRSSPRLAGLGDFVIRLALLGTFIGLIAALTIASANVGIVQDTEQAQSEHMRHFIEQLLASAATKFWISAIGIACALLLRFWQTRLDRQLTDLASSLGLSFDLALAKPEIARAWCPSDSAIVDPAGGLVAEIANELKARTSDLVISFAPGRNATPSSSG